MNLSVFTGGSVATNGYLFSDGDTTVLIDAPEGVFDWLSQQGITPDALLLTHQHFDHVEDAHRFEGPVYAHSAFSDELTIAEWARSMGLPTTVPAFTVTHPLPDQGDLKIGTLTFRTLAVPGHSPDSLAFHLPSEAIAFVGDTLFNSGAGRTDLPGSNGPLLKEGIREKLLTLPPETKILPGHGPETTPQMESPAY